MNLLRQYIKSVITEAEVYEKDIREHPCIVKLSNRASRVFASKTSFRMLIDHPEDGCSVLLHIEWHDEPTPENALWVEKLEVIETKYGDIDLECFGKGYAKEALQLLASAADQTGTHLFLIAAPEAWLRRQYPQLPDKDSLAGLYSRYGFVETSSNYAQVHMERKPR